MVGLLLPPDKRARSLKGTGKGKNAGRPAEDDGTDPEHARSGSINKRRGMHLTGFHRPLRALRK